ncbi:MAG: FeoA family protein [Bacillota bacterium]
MKLEEVRTGQHVRITSIPDEQVRAQIIRFGIAEGEVVTCVEVIPAGPVIIAKNKQEIAIGRKLARRIGVESVAYPACNVSGRAQHAVS